MSTRTDNADNTLLISILGRVPRDQNGKYRSTTYDFGDGLSEDAVAFFGWSLRRRLAPQRILILGTTGSMWDHLFEEDIDLGTFSEKERTDLMEAVAGKQVTQAQLNELAPLLMQHLGCVVDLILIPYCQTEAEQTDMLRILAEHVHEREIVHLDITHGFRHLPMLALLSALHLRLVRQANVAGIWYGTYDDDTKKAPVYRLDGLLRIADWLQALSSFDKDGDYRSFVPLMHTSGITEKTCKLLSEAAYYENILNVGEATGKLRQGLQGLKTEQPTQPEMQLALPLVEDRLKWVSEPRQYEKLVALAHQSFQRKDYLRAILYAYESVITRLCQHKNISITDFKGRESVRDGYEQMMKSQRDAEEGRLYSLLKNLRNQVAHGTRGATQEVQRVLLNEPAMVETLTRVLEAIDQNELPHIC
jgi:CRISPR-associated Csx2 family protein